MAWQTSGSNANNKYWTYSTSAVGMTRTNVVPLGTFSLWYSTTSKRFSSEKNYLFKINVNNFGHANTYKYLVAETPWGDRFTHSHNATPYLSTLPYSSSENVLNFYSKPPSSASYTNVAFYKSTYNGFGTVSGVPSVIKSIDIIELDWFIQGWAWATASANMGWRYNNIDNSFQYTYQPSATDRRQPSRGHTHSNYISKYIPFDSYNLFFNFSMSGNTTNGYIDLYLTENLPSTSTTLSTFTASLWPSTRVASGVFSASRSSRGPINVTNQYIGRISATLSNTSINYEFYNLSGNKYLTAVANFSGPTNYQMDISDVIIQGGYQETDNNEQFLFTNSDVYEEPTPLSVIGGSSDATYSSVTTTIQTLHDPVVGNNFGATGYPGFFSNVYGVVTNLSQLYSKVGNGTFRSGVWENGVWNSGWRVDDQIYDFNDVIGAFSTETRNTRWRVLITGPTSSTSQFEIGDKVSIGNIVSININEERKLLKNYFTIINKNETDLVVEFDNNFPIRRITKDSENHKIRITKNVWLNGGFLNGYFEGVWNNGLFKGYPLITEMDNTHWIDGTFDGGHFSSNTIEYNFVDTWYQNGYVGLSFSATHSFLSGDLIYIEKDDININPQYNGNSTVTSVVDEYLIIIDKEWGSNSTLESGLVRRRTKTGLIQNFKFKDNNVASKTSKTSTVIKDIWRFNSWIDVNYSTDSTTNIGKDRIMFNSSPSILPSDFIDNRKYGLGEYSQMNLYGYITEDVLSSDSTFRDIDSFSKRKYKLGTKYEIYNDFLGDKSQFNKPFGHSVVSGGLNNFFIDGWTYSFSGTFSLVSTPTAFTFSRTVDGTLDVLFADKAVSAFVLDNNNVNIENKRYSIIEFDLVNYEAPQIYTTGGTLSETYLDYSPITFFNYPLISDNDGWTNQPGFPIQENVDYRYTTSTRKVEYFYNRSSIDLGVFGRSYYIQIDDLSANILQSTGIRIELDNIKFYEVDSIPFFQYTTEDYVNKSVQVPYQGSAPFIDYNNVNFSFVDNIVISLDSVQVSPSNTTFVPSNSIGGGNTLYEIPEER
jgi:hypothetical protein